MLVLRPRPYVRGCRNLNVQICLKLINIGMLVLRPSPYVRGCIIHPLNVCRKGLAWLQESPILEWTRWMDVQDTPMRWWTHGLVPNECVRTSQDGQCIPKHGTTSQCMDRVVGYQDDNEMWRDCVAHDGACTHERRVWPNKLVMSLSLSGIKTNVISSVETAWALLKTHDLKNCSRPQTQAFKKFIFNFFDIAFSPHSDYRREMGKICILELLDAERVISYESVRVQEVGLLTEAISKLASFHSEVICSHACHYF